MTPIPTIWDLNREASQAAASGHDFHAENPAAGSEPSARQPTPPARRVERRASERDDERARRSPAPEPETRRGNSGLTGGTTRHGQAASVGSGLGDLGVPAAGDTPRRSNTPPARRVTRPSRAARREAVRTTAAATRSPSPEKPREGPHIETPVPLSLYYANGTPINVHRNQWHAPPGAQNPK